MAGYASSVREFAVSNVHSHTEARKPTFFAEGNHVNSDI